MAVSFSIYIGTVQNFMQNHYRHKTTYFWLKTMFSLLGFSIWSSRGISVIQNHWYDGPYWWSYLSLQVSCGKWFQQITVRFSCNIFNVDRLTSSRHLHLSRLFLWPTLNALRPSTVDNWTRRRPTVPARPPNLVQQEISLTQHCKGNQSCFWKINGFCKSVVFLMQNF